MYIKSRFEIFINILVYIGLGVALIIAIYPFFTIILMSLRPRVLSFTLPPVYIFKPTLSHFRDTFLWHSGLIRNLWNSIIISSSTTLIAVITGTLAAYAFSRINFKAKDFFFQWILTFRMLPAISVVLPFFIMFTRLEIYDTLLAVIVTHVIIDLPMAIWLMKSFIDELPEELDEAARIDGCSRMGAFWRICMPLSAPALVATAILCFLFSWNEYLFAVCLTSTKARPILIATQGLMSYQGMRWGQLAVLCIIIIIPAILVVLFFQRYLIRGLTFGAVKA